MSIAIRTSQNVVLEYEPASIGDRILSTLLDYLVFLGWVLLTLAVPAGLGMRLGTFYVVLALLPIVFYDLLCEYFLNGQSVGKLALGTRRVTHRRPAPAYARKLRGSVSRRPTADRPRHQRSA